jgi:Protein of unknown function (DUF3015)
MKMKALLLGGLILSVTATVAMADQDVGCGWGTQAFKGSEGKTAKILAAITNGSFGSQTFGISSNTAGCTGEGVIASAERLNMYAGANIDELQRDIALGQGESLTTLAHLMGIQDADKPAFYSMTKSHFADIFPSADVTAGQMLTSISQLMSSDPALSQYTL